MHKKLEKFQIIIILFSKQTKNENEKKTKEIFQTTFLFN